jgi:hypothetical protein
MGLKMCGEGQLGFESDRTRFRRVDYNASAVKIYNATSSLEPILVLRYTTPAL